MAQVVIALTIANSSSGVWYAPVDCTGNITVELIGPGMGGGGAYTKNTLSVTPGKKYYVNFLTDTWINTTNTAPTSSTTGAKAAGGGANGTGGQASACIPNTTGVTFSGGNGQPISQPYGSFWGGSNGQGFGGAAGPSGPGGNGTATVAGNGGTGGSSNGRAAGYNGGVSNQTIGTKDPIYTDFTGKTYGPAGGAGGGNLNTGKGWNGWEINANVAAGGGGDPGYAGSDPLTGSAIPYTAGNNGLIVITYTPTQIAGTYTEVFANTGTTPWRVPAGVTSVKAEAIGGGGGGGSISSYGNSSPVGGGGGGAYAATNAVTVTPGSIAYVGVAVVGFPAYYNSSSSTSYPSWFNTTNALPTSTNTGVKADGSMDGGAYTVFMGFGGLASNSIGDIAYNGGSGGLSYKPEFYGRGAGGGGSAGPGGAGKAGGRDYLTLNSVGGGGGGGGAGGTSSTAGNTATSSVGAQGGSGPSGTAGGAGSPATANAVAGTNGSGGGGGSGGTGTYRNGARGGVYAQWTNLAGDTFGPSGGGGGAGSPASNTPVGIAGYGGTYGGGGGGHGINYVSSVAYPQKGSPGGQGLVVLTYTVVGGTAAAAATNNFFLMF